MGGAMGIKKGGGYITNSHPRQYQGVMQTESKLEMHL